MIRASGFTITTGLLTLSVVLAVAGCGSNPHSLKITEANKDSFMEELKDSKGLTVEEVGLLTSLQMRRAAAKALGGTDVVMVGKTVGDVINDQRAFVADAEAKQKEQDRLAAEAKAKAEAIAAQLRESINLTVFEKGFTPSRPMDGRFDDFITLNCVYENKSGKDIRAFRGQVRFTDLFGKEIFTTSMTISDPVAAGQKATWSGAIKFNQFVTEQQNLRNANLNDMKVVWLPQSVLFADGSALGESESSK